MQTKLGNGSRTLTIGGRPVAPPRAADLARRSAYVGDTGRQAAPRKAAPPARPMPGARYCRAGEVDSAVVASMASVAARCAADLDLGPVKVSFFTELDTAERAAWKARREDFTAIQALEGPVPAGFARSATPHDIYLNHNRWSASKRDPWALAYTVAHECRHLAQYRRRWPGRGGQTADEKATAAAGDEADAHAYAAAMVDHLWQEANRG